VSTIKPFLLGVAVGAGALYLLDPVMGRTRRSKAADQVISGAHSAQDQVSGTLDLATDKVMGTVADALPDSKPENDQALTAKVRSEVLGDADWRDYTINVDAADGVVTLRGEVRTPEHRDAIAEAVGKVTGVSDVENLLHLPGQQPQNTQPSVKASGRSR
jgi:osmotically-inducible protein OsmY